MIKIISLLAILFCTISAQAYSLKNIRDTIYQEAELIHLSRDLKKDTVMMLELMASYHFHQLINKYRTSKRKKTIYWDFKLWLAARNHSVFMLHNPSEFSHRESRSKPYFTGKSPGNRIDYVIHQTMKQEDFTGYAENIAVAGVGGIGGPDLNGFKDVSMQDLIVMAKDAAEDMFDLWKHSPGHNENMLRRDHLAHGTSIVFGKISKYATSVFIIKKKYYSPDTISVDFLGENADQFPNLYKENGQEYKNYPRDMDRVKFKLFSSLAEQFRTLQVEPEKTLYELVKYEDTHPEDQLPIKKRFIKANSIFSGFRLIGRKLNTLEDSRLFSFEDFYSLAGIEYIKEFILKNSALVTSSKSWGGVVDVSSKGNQFEVVIRVFLLN